MKAVAAMKVSAEKEAAELYEDWSLNAEDEEIIIDAEELRKAKLRFELKNREVAWFKAWEVAQLKAQAKAEKDAALAAKIASDKAHAA